VQNALQRRLLQAAHLACLLRQGRILIPGDQGADRAEVRNLV
jgi:DNA-binding transcriptional regulator/RsmH inhibitor MraZ